MFVSSCYKHTPPLAHRRVTQCSLKCTGLQQSLIRKREEGFAQHLKVRAIPFAQNQPAHLRVPCVRYPVRYPVCCGIYLCPEDEDGSHGRSDPLDLPRKLPYQIAPNELLSVTPPQRALRPVHTACAAFSPFSPSVATRGRAYMGRVRRGTTGWKSFGPLEILKTVCRRNSL